MDDIAKHARQLTRQYKRSSNAEAVIASAKMLARMVLLEPSLLPSHRDWVLNSVQWFVSEVDGKHATRYRSKSVVELAKTDPDSKVKINHEHVFTRMEMVACMVAVPERCSELLDTVIGCLVTAEEHRRLKVGSGWARYQDAGIIVLDMSTSPPSVHVTI